MSRPRKATERRRLPAVRRAVRPEAPDKSNPLAEPTPQRRLWAAYLARGFTRASFARALGAQYSSLDHWDTGVTAMSLKTFARGAQLVRYSLDELVFGVAAQSAPAGHLLTLPPPDAAGMVVEYSGELPIERRRAVLAELGASAEERAAFGAVHHEPPCAYYLITESYLRTWVMAFRHFGTLTDDVMQAARHACDQALRVADGSGSKTPAVQSVDSPPSAAPRSRGKSA